MINTFSKVTLHGVEYSLCFDTDKNEYHVREEGRLVSKIHVRKEFLAAKALYSKLTNKA